MHDTVDKSLEAPDAGGFVSLSTGANKATELLLFLPMMSEEREYLKFINAKSLFTNVITHLKIRDLLIVGVDVVVCVYAHLWLSARCLGSKLAELDP